MDWGSINELIVTQCAIWLRVWNKQPRSLAERVNFGSMWTSRDSPTTHCRFDFPTALEGSLQVFVFLGVPSVGSGLVAAHSGLL